MRGPRYRESVSPVASAVLAAIPSPDRGVWFIGPVPIRAYALCIIAGIVVAVVWGERRIVARGGPAGLVTDVAVWAVPFGLIGGRLYHVATDWQTYFGPGRNPLDALKIWEGGLGIWGAIALGAVGAWIGCRRRGVPLPFFADAVAPGIVVAQAIGRLGNYFNQELYGAPTDLPWGLEIYRRVNEFGQEDPLNGVAVDHVPVEVVHPTFLYELIINLLVAALVVWADRRFRLGHGRAFAVYVAGYTAGRFFIEQMRTDYATRVFGDIRVNVVVSAVVFIGAVLYIALVRKPREVLDLAPDADKPDGDAGPDLGKAAPAGRPRTGGGGVAVADPEEKVETAVDLSGTGEPEAGARPAKTEPRPAPVAAEPAPVVVEAPTAATEPAAPATPASTAAPTDAVPTDAVPTDAAPTDDAATDDADAPTKATAATAPTGASETTAAAGPAVTETPADAPPAPSPDGTAAPADTAAPAVAPAPADGAAPTDAAAPADGAAPAAAAAPADSATAADAPPAPSSQGNPDDGPDDADRRPGRNEPGR